MGGTFEHNYSYDASLDRLPGADGHFSGKLTNNESDYQSKYQTQLTYNNTHGIASKHQYHEKNNALYPANTYKNTDKYEEGTHRVASVEDENIAENFKYDLNGNIINRAHSQNATTAYKWDESNRLRVVFNAKGFMQHSIYDATANGF